MKTAVQQSRTSPVPADLDGLLAPMSSGEFLTSHWSRGLLYQPGWRGKFAELLAWMELNRVLEQHGLEAPQLQLVKSGAWVNPHTYTEYRPKDGRLRARIMAKEFNAQLRDGATLILNNADDLHPPLRTLAESLEHFFGVPVGVNAYAGWRTCQGFVIHSDEHDAFVLQVSGRKRWLIYGPGRKFEKTEGLPSDPVCDQIIGDGDFIYMPRGYPHVAIPLDEPCLHLTVSVSNPAAPDVLSWLAGQLRSGELGQLCVSRFADRAQRHAFVSRLRDEVLQTLDAEVLDRYFESSDTNRRAIVHLGLPWSATAAGLPLEDGVLVRFTGRRTPVFHIDQSSHSIQFTVARKTWRFPLIMRPFLEALSGGRVLSVSELIAAGQGTVNPQMGRALIAALVKEGVAFIVSEGSGNHAGAV